MDSGLGTFYFDPILRAWAVHSAWSKGGHYVTDYHYPNRQSLWITHSPKDSCKKSSKFDMTFFSNWSFPKKVSNVFPSGVVPWWRLKEGKSDTEHSMPRIDLRQRCNFPSQTWVRPTHDYEDVPSRLFSNGLCGNLEGARKSINCTFRRRISKFDAL